MKELFLAFWNLENLFDVEEAHRTDKLRKALGSSLGGWTQALLNAKLGQLSRLIRSLNEGKGPDVLGVCEAENRRVLELLTGRILQDGGRSYDIIHAEMDDRRGIDLAFLYDASRAVPEKNGVFQHWVVKRSSTRDLLQANILVDGKPLILVANHWPSRSGGQYESEPYRMTAGETLSYWLQRIHEEKGLDIGVVAMGDFNDEPFNRSLLEYALAVNDPRQVIQAKSNHLFQNLMWPLLGEGIGSYWFDGAWNMLDQFLVSQAVVSGKSGWTVKSGPRIEGAGLMRRPRSPGPRRFGVTARERDLEGFSDHYPVSLTLMPTA